MAYRFEPLSGSHNRQSFRSSSAVLNTYLQTIARKDVERRVSAAFVMVEESAPETIIGFYTLSAFTIEVTDLPGGLQKKLPRYPFVPATLLGRLARDERFPGTGSLLLMNALERAFSQTAHIASIAVVADAKDHAALEFYKKYGFENLAGHPNRVFLPMETIGRLLSGRAN